MTVGYFAKSIFRKTCILCNFMSEELYMSREAGKPKASKLDIFLGHSVAL